MLQPPILDKCRALGAVTAYVESNDTHILNSAYGHPNSEVMNPSCLAHFPLDDLGNTNAARQVGMSPNQGLWSGTHTYTADTPAADPGWVDPLSHCTTLTGGTSMSASLNDTRGVVVPGKGCGLGFWFKHPSSGTNTAHTAVHWSTVAVLGEGNQFVNISIKVQFASDNSCRKPTVTIEAGSNTTVLEPDDDDHPWNYVGGLDMDDTWHHLMVAVGASGQHRLYMNGLLAAANTPPANFGYDNAIYSTIAVGKNIAGSDGLGNAALLRMAHLCVYRVKPTTEDVARIVSSFTRPLDMVKDSSVEVVSLEGSPNLPYSRCDHGYCKVMDTQPSSTSPRQFRLTDWRNLERGFCNTQPVNYLPSVFLGFQLAYDDTVNDPPDNQGEGTIMGFNGTGFSNWPKCGGTHASDFNTTFPDGFFFARSNRGWKANTSYRLAGDAASLTRNRDFSKTDIYPAQVSQTYDTVRMQHEKTGNDSLLTIRTGADGSYAESSPTSVRDGTIVTAQTTGAFNFGLPSVDQSRYSVMSLFRSNIAESDYLEMRRLVLGQAQMRSRPGLRMPNRHYTQTAPSRGQEFIQ